MRLYQRFARDMLRMSCRFTPTCSQYMILAIKKYGWRRGVLKGIKRLARCKYPNGGEDYP
ncbi:MAG: membrane protein insertion efficiency factor YidD [Firmicutes bacterium]|nr:membrane protein insertion efficiency factor YidD [Bacillota bacterium]